MMRYYITIISNNGNSVVVVPSKFRYDWLSPFGRVVLPPALQDEIMGFCRPCLPRRPSASFDDTIELGSSSIRSTTTNTVNNNNRMIINSPSRGTSTKTIRSVEQIL